MTTTPITAQIARARYAMQVLINMGAPADVRERQERIINRLKARQMRAVA